MINRDVFEHLNEAVEGDVAAIREWSGELSAASVNLPRCQSTLEIILTNSNGALVSEQNASRPSLRLLRAGYNDFMECPTPEVARFVQDNLFPLVGLEEAPEPLPVATAGSRSGVGCDDSEDYFYDSASQLARDHYVGHRRISVYRDEEGRPLLYRKSHVESTALSLVPLSLHDMYVPPGSIVSVGSDTEVALTARHPCKYYDVEVYTLGGGGRLPVNPLRLSAWAFSDPLDRALFACEGNPQPYEYDVAKGEMLQAVTLANFMAASLRIIELCGMANED